MSERKRKWDQPADGSPNVKPKLEMSPPGGADDAGAAAAAIAARIAAQYGGGGGAGASESPARSSEGPRYERDKPELNDPEFVKDIDINDVRNRYLLTKGPTQLDVHKETGCSVTTKGQWYPDRSMATDRDPPLYLHLTATTQEILDKGVAKVMELIDQDLGPLTEQRRDRREPRERVKWPEHKIPIELETLRNFNVRAKVVGPGGLFVKHIQSETGCRVQIKGLGSGFIETETGAEAPEPMHINVAGPDEKMNDRAKELAEDLLAVVKEKWQEAQAVNQGYNPGMYQGGYPGYGAQPQGYGGYPGYAAPPPPSSDAPPPPPPSDAPPLPPGEAPPPAPPSSAPPASGADYSAYYAQYYGQQGQAPGQGQQQMTPEQQAYYNSPEYKAWYQQYLAQYQQQQGQQSPPAQPPPPTGAAPPPPPA